MRKELIVLVVVILAGYNCFTTMQETREKRAQADYDKIRQVYNAAQDACYSGATNSFDGTKSYVYEVSALAGQDDRFAKAMSAKLGSGFDGTLSNEEKLWVNAHLEHRENKIYPVFEIYAGETYKASVMVYPDWKYRKLDPIDLP